MNAGVRTSPCARCRTPARAEPARAPISNSSAMWRSLGLRRSALDRRGLALAVAVPRDLDAARLALLGLRHDHLEHSVVERGDDLAGVDALGQRQRAAELAERALEAEEALLLALVLEVALAGDRQRAVGELDGHVLLLHPGKVGLEQVVVLALDQVHGRHPALGDGATRLEERVEEPVEVGRKRFGTYDKTHLNTSCQG